MYVLCNRLTTLAKIPTKTAGGCDIYSCENIVLDPGQRIPINSGVSFKFPDGYFGMIFPSSFISLVKRIDIAPDIVDFDLRFEVCVLAQNNTDEKVKVEVGDKIARMVICKDTQASFLYVNA